MQRYLRLSNERQKRSRSTTYDDEEIDKDVVDLQQNSDLETVEDNIDRDLKETPPKQPTAEQIRRALLLLEEAVNCLRQA